jgi:hypothetical protein
MDVGPQSNETQQSSRISLDANCGQQFGIDRATGAQVACTDTTESRWLEMLYLPVKAILRMSALIADSECHPNSSEV